MQKRMFFNLYLKPLLVMFGGLFAWFFLGVFVPNQVSNIPIMAKVAESSFNLAPIVFWLCCLVSSVWFLVQTYKLWKWEQGLGENCVNCGGIVTQKHGRYGLYVHCLACGKNSSI